MQANYVDKNVELKLYLSIFFEEQQKAFKYRLQGNMVFSNPSSTHDNEEHVIKRNLLQAKTIEHENFTWDEPLICCLMSWSQNRIDRNNIPELVPNNLQ